MYWVISQKRNDKQLVPNTEKSLSWPSSRRKRPVRQKMQRSDTKKYHLEVAPSRSGELDLISSVADWRMLDSPMSEHLRKLD